MSDIKKFKILVVAAHPDDEVLGCGGTIARLAKEGHEVNISILGEGITSRYDQREKADFSLVELLQKRSHQAAGIMGAHKVFTHNLPDNRFDTIPLLEVVKLVEGLMEGLAPEVIYTHFEGDLNIDHRIVNRAVLTATRPLQGQSVREIYAFEVPSSTEWAFHRLSPSFTPNVFLDISETLATKIEALLLYESEVHPFPHPRSVEALKTNARRWGAVVGCEAAEAFELVRAIR